jgi:CRP/FNR family transcriptional regulator, cyclic AMP receptor protein
LEEAPVDHAEDALSRAPLFEALDEEGAKALRSMLADVELSRGDRLFDEGDAGDRLYVVLEGKIKLTRAASDGRENLLSVLGPGEMFGELSLFDPRPRTSSAVAVTDARLAALAHADLLSWLTGRPDVALHLLRALAQRLRRANDVMADLVFTDVPGRVAKALLDLADRFGEQQDEGLQVHHDLTQEELAQLVGASRETVNKALADFAARGWLQLSAKSVLLIDPDRLAKRAR